MPKSGNVFFKDSAGGADSWAWEPKAKSELEEGGAAGTLEKLQCLRSQIEQYALDHEDFKPNMRDEFQMAFLRTRKFNVDKAFKAYVNYFTMHLTNPEKIYPVGKGPLDYPNVWDRPIASIMRRRNPIDGSFVLVWSYRYARMGEDPVEDVFSACLPLLVELFEDPAVQTYGLHMVFDNQGMSFAFLRAVLARFYLIRTMIIFQGALPIRFKGFHVINEPYGISKRLFVFIKPFISSKLRDRVHFHGYDMTELHKLISPTILPEEFGGGDGPFSAEWMRGPLEEVNSKIVEYSYYGFTKQDP